MIVLPLMFTAISSDLHIIICTFLHPSDILELRKVCVSSINIRQVNWGLFQRLVKFFNLLQSSESSGLTPFIEYASTMPFFYQVSLYPRWVTCSWNKLRSLRIGGSSSVLSSQDNIQILITLARPYARKRQESSSTPWVGPNCPYLVPRFSLCQAGDTSSATRL